MSKKKKKKDKEEKLLSLADFEEPGDFELYVWSLLISGAQPDAAKGFIFEKLKEIQECGMGVDDAIEVGRSIYINSLQTGDKVLH